MVMNWQEKQEFREALWAGVAQTITYAAEMTLEELCRQTGHSEQKIREELDNGLNMPVDFDYSDWADEVCEAGYSEVQGATFAIEWALLF